MIIYTDGPSDFKYKQARNNELLPDSLGKYPKMLTELYKTLWCILPSNEGSFYQERVELQSEKL